MAFRCLARVDLPEPLWPSTATKEPSVTSKSTPSNTMGLVCFPSLADRNYKVYQRESGLANTHIQAIGEDKATSCAMLLARAIRPAFEAA